MGSCAASGCTCFPKASSAFATSASWPTADAPLSCRFAFKYSAQYRADRTTTLPGSASQPALALSPMWRSHGGDRETYRCPAPTSCSTLSRRSRRMKLQSQAPSLGALTTCRRCVHSCPQTSCPFPTSTQNPVPATCKLQRDPPGFRFFELHHIFPKPLPQTQHH